MTATYVPNLTITSLTELDPTQVSQTATTIQAMLADQYPNFDLGPGSVLNAQVVLPFAEAQTLVETQVTALRQANLQTAISNPSSVDPTLLAALFSNYGLTPNPGTYATGQVRIVLNTNVSVLVTTAAQFTATNGVVFQPTAAFVGKTNPTLPNDVQISAYGTNQFSFILTVQANTTGLAGNISSGTVLTTNLTSPAVVQTLAASDFDGGGDAETNQQLAARAAQGLTNKTLGARGSVVAATENAFPFVQDVAVVGAGDAEMQRSAHPLFGTKGAGCVDVYARTRPAPILTTFTLTATLTNVTNGTWSIIIGRDVYPGFYRVVAVRPTTGSISGTLPICTSTTGVDLTPISGLEPPSTLTTLTGAFTRYQTGTVTFTDNSGLTNLAVNATRSYYVDILGPPQIDVVSDYFAARANNCPGGNYLFKAAVPCLVGLGVTVVQGAGDPVPSPTAITAAAIAAVNGLDFQTGRLPTTILVSAIQATLGPRSRIALPMDIRGVILAPDGTNKYLYGPADLVAPYDPAIMVTVNTVFFSLGSNSVSVTVLPPDQLTF